MFAKHINRSDWHPQDKIPPAICLLHHSFRPICHGKCTALTTLIVQDLIV